MEIQVDSGYGGVQIFRRGGRLTKAERERLASEYNADAAMVEAALGDAESQIKWRLSRLHPFSLEGTRKAKRESLLSLLHIRAIVPTEFSENLLCWMDMSRELISLSAIDYVQMIRGMVADTVQFEVEKREGEDMQKGKGLVKARARGE